MLGHIGDEREGALLRRFKEVGQGSRPSRLGFATGEAGSKRRPMVIVARVSHGAALVDQLQALAEAGVDAVEVALHVGGDSAEVARAIATVEVPCGIFIAGGSVRDWSAVTGAERVDWIHVAASAPAHLLTAKGPTRLISLSTDEPPGRLPGLAGLKADAAVVESPTGGGSFTVDTLLALCTIQAAIKGPLLAGSSLAVTPDDVHVLHDHGVEGLLVAGDAGTVSAFVKAVEAL